MNKETVCGQVAFVIARMMRVIVPNLTIVALMTGCTSMGGSVTERTICTELRRDLPTWSTQDTEQSKRQGADFIETFNAICPAYPPYVGSFLGGVAYG